MNPVHLQQFLPNLHNWTSVNQLYQAQMASSKRMEIWQKLRFTNKLWNVHNFEYGSSAKLFTNCMKANTLIRTSGLWVTEVVKVNFHCRVKAGFHMIADDRGSRIADRRKFCDRLRSYGNTLLRSPAILRSWSQTIAEDRTMFYLLRSSAIVCDPAIIWKPKFCDLRSKCIS